MSESVLLPLLERGACSEREAAALMPLAENLRVEGQTGCISGLYSDHRQGFLQLHVFSAGVSSGSSA